MRICLYTNTALPKLADRRSSSTRWPGSFSPWDTIRSYWPPGADRRARSTRLRCRIRWPGIRGSCPRNGAYRGMAIGWAKLHRAHGFDVIHCHGTYPAGYVGACCQAVRHLPLVITSHGDDLAPQGLYDRKPGLRGRYRTGPGAGRCRRGHQRLHGRDVSRNLPAVTADRADSQRRRSRAIRRSRAAAGESRRGDSPQVLSALSGAARSAEGDRRFAGGNGLAARPERS